MLDGIGFGLPVGGPLELHTTLCHEARLSGKTIVFDQASVDPTYKDHHTPWGGIVANRMHRDSRLVCAASSGSEPRRAAYAWP